MLYEIIFHPLLKIDFTFYIFNYIFIRVIR